MADSPTTCPFCNDSILIPEEFIGSEVECPNCHKQFMIPNIADDTLDPGLVIIDCPTCGTQNIIEEDFAGTIKCKNCSSVLDITFEEMIPCPFCGKDISKNDTTCMHCQRELQSDPIPKKTVGIQPVNTPAAKAVPITVVPANKQGKEEGNGNEQEDNYVLSFLQGMKLVTILFAVGVLSIGILITITNWERAGITALAIVLSTLYIALLSYFVLCWLRGIYRNVLRIRIAAEKKSDS